MWPWLEILQDLIHCSHVPYPWVMYELANYTNYNCQILLDMCQYINFPTNLWYRPLSTLGLSSSFPILWFRSIGTPVALTLELSSFIEEIWYIFPLRNEVGVGNFDPRKYFSFLIFYLKFSCYSPLGVASQLSHHLI